MRKRAYDHLQKLRLKLPLLMTTCYKALSGVSSKGGGEEGGKGVQEKDRGGVGNQFFRQLKLS